MNENRQSEDLNSLRGRVYNSLREDILSGKYKPGDNLIELKIADELNVSRTPVRESIRKLELEGLVESIPNKGARVRGISKKDMEDIYQIRMILEGLAARWAVEQVTQEEIKELQELYDLMEFYTLKDDVDNISRLNTKFHEIIYFAAKSNILLSILKDFQFYVKWARHESLSTPGRKEEALREHYNILQAFKTKSVSDAEKYLIIHVENSSKNVLRETKKV